MYKDRAGTEGRGWFCLSLVSGNANGRDRNEEMYGGVLKELELEPGQSFLKRNNNKKKN